MRTSFLSPSEERGGLLEPAGFEVSMRAMCEGISFDPSTKAGLKPKSASGFGKSHLSNLAASLLAGATSFLFIQDGFFTGVILLGMTFIYRFDI